MTNITIPEYFYWKHFNDTLTDNIGTNTMLIPYLGVGLKLTIFKIFHGYIVIAL